MVVGSVIYMISDGMHSKLEDRIVVGNRQHQNSILVLSNFHFINPFKHVRGYDYALFRNFGLHHLL